MKLGRLQLYHLHINSETKSLGDRMPHDRHFSASAQPDRNNHTETRSAAGLVEHIFPRTLSLSNLCSTFAVLAYMFSIYRFGVPAAGSLGGPGVPVLPTIPRREEKSAAA